MYCLRRNEDLYYDDIYTIKKFWEHFCNVLEIEESIINMLFCGVVIFPIIFIFEFSGYGINKCIDKLYCVDCDLKFKCIFDNIED